VNAFCTWLTAHGTSCLEFVAVLFGIVGVYLSILEKISNWPIGIVNVSLYALLFWQQRLYANAGLQIVYLGISVYGWYRWVRGDPSGGALVVRTTTRPLALKLIMATIAIWIGLVVLTRAFGGTMPILDAGTTAVSLVAEWMLARKLFENWAVWIAVDAVYVGMLLSDQLYLTAINYAVYFVLAVMGYVAWRRLALQPAAA
jgi:nicotinamide mononucleotide transporter